MLLHRIKKYMTLRNQILFFFLSAMVIVLVIVGLVIFNMVGDILRNNAEKQIQQTAVQASARIDALYRQIDDMTTQVATNTNVQNFFEKEMDGKKADFRERQAIMSLVHSYQAHSNGIISFELYYPDYELVYPIDGSTLLDKINEKWVVRADQAKGKMVWAGKNPIYGTSYVAIKRISLMDRWYAKGGYLLVYIDKNYFNLNHGEDDFYSIFDNDLELVSSTLDKDVQKEVLTKNGSVIDMNHKEYFTVKQESDMIQWTLVILTPIEKLTEGIGSLRIAVLVSGAIGFLIFFIISLNLSATISRPIFKLIETMKNKGEGELIPTFEKTSINEIEELNNTYNKLVEETNHLIQVVYEKEILRSRTELKALQAQINPHFLFNTLNALYWALEEKGEDELANQVIAMSDLFRYTISQSKTGEWVKIEDELTHIERYLKVMQMRLGKNLDWEVHVDGSIRYSLIPKLLIQPIVENAVLHGVGNKSGHGKVNLIISKIGTSYIRVVVQDQGKGMDEETIQEIRKALKDGAFLPSGGTGMGLMNVNKRIQLYYEKSAGLGLVIDSKLNEGTTVLFEVPIVERSTTEK